MNIYYVDRELIDMNTYDSFICFAKTEEEARFMHPDNNWEKEPVWQDWCKKEECGSLKVTLLGVAQEEVEAKAIHSSYNGA